MRKRKNKMSIEDFDDEDDMPCPCDECGEWFDLEDGMTHPRKNTLIICDSCATQIQKEVDREEEIQDILTELSDAEWTVGNCKKRLDELGYKPESK